MKSTKSKPVEEVKVVKVVKEVKPVKEVKSVKVVKPVVEPKQTRTKLVKGSQEAKDYMKSIRDKRSK